LLYQFTALVVFNAMLHAYNVMSRQPYTLIEQNRIKDEIHLQAENI